MHLYKTYNDLLKIESGLQEQINMTKHKLYIHHGMDLDNEDFIGFIGGGQIGYEFGMNTAVKQLDSRITYLNKVYAELREVETKKDMLTKHMSRLESLEHRILYLRLIEGKEVKEI